MKGRKTGYKKDEIFKDNINPIQERTENEGIDNAKYL